MSYADEALRDLEPEKRKILKKKKLNNMYTKENLMSFAEFVTNYADFNLNTMDKLFEEWQDQAGLKFFVNSDKKTPILELKVNGDILVKGNKIQNDIEVYDALKEFIEKTKEGVV
jgi:RAB protein geranylgeranyltransferase component A